MNTMRLAFKKNNLFSKGFIVMMICVHVMTFANAQSYTRTATGIKTTINDITTEVIFFRNDIVRVKKYPKAADAAVTSFSVIGKPAATTLSITDDKEKITIKSNAITVLLKVSNGALQFFDNEGKVLLEEKDEKDNFIKDGDEPSYKIKQSFKLEQDEAIYGFGQFQNGHMSQRRQELDLKQQNMQIVVPFFQSVKKYGVFWDNASWTHFKDTANIATLQSASAKCIDYYFFNGKNADSVIAAYRYLTGTVPMFPRYVFGYWQSRERYTSQQEILDVVNSYRRLKVPLDGIVQDWQYWGEDRADWNAVAFGNPRFTNPKAMLDSVHAMNAHMIISVWPSFGYNTSIYKELEEKKMLLSIKTWPPENVKVYDPFNPDARNIYWSHMKKDLFSLGIDGWWLDATEPEKAGPEISIDTAQTFLGSFKKVGNAFPIQTTGGVSDHQKADTKDKRVFILTRSAFAGQQRYGTMVWSGDIQGRWDVLRAQIAAACNLSMSSIPYWNSDIGGFFTNEKYPLGIKDPAYQELYVRWLQFATCTPMMRSHGTNTPREIYQFGGKGDWAYDAIEKYINLRYRLLPYIYSNAWDMTAHNSTMMRALAMDFSADKKVWDINNEYLFGKSILVAPVTDSLYTSRVDGSAKTDFTNTKQTTIYLPAGADWFDFWTGEKLKGGQETHKQVPIDIIPLYVKSGSILPIASAKQYAAACADTSLEIRVYAGADASFTLYEDEGDNYNYEKGMYATITFKWNDKTRQLQILDRKGTFKGMLKNRAFNIVLVDAGHGIGISADARHEHVLKYAGKAVQVKL